MKNSTNNVLNLLIALPIFWFFTGYLFISGGDKITVSLFVVSILSILIKYKLQTLKININETYIKIILISAIYGSILYLTIGYGSSEVRTLIASTVFFLFYPKDFLNRKNLSYLLLIGSIISFAFIYYNKFYLGLNRGAYIINPIPYAITLSIYAIITLNYFLKDKSYALFGAFILYLLSVIITETRGAILPLLIASAFMLLMKAKQSGINKKGSLLTIIVIVFVTIPSFNFIKERVKVTIHDIETIQAGNENTSIGLRLQMWKASPLMITQSPIYGNGDSHREKLQELYKKGSIDKSLADFSPAHYHNQFIDKLIKSGFIGLALFFLVIYYPLYHAVKYKTNKDILLGIALLVTLTSLTDTPFGQSFCLFPILFSNYLLTSKGIKTN
ncbi:O-antigen ligase family protein [Photobacterium frigidiphilum]|uniref:O-antigen ligase family protein n=1 Tax=Photobacterium frigidiphilum TaxID=264736 RepID=UPI003D09C908